MPFGEAPHREVAQDAGRRTRLELCRLAAADDEWLEASGLEVDREGPSYTVTTLRLLREQRPDDELWIVLGADQALTLPRWHEPEEVLSLASVAVAERDGVGSDEVRSAIGALEGSERVRFFSMPRVDVSSSMVRARVAAGQPINHLVPARVAKRIEEAGLYREPVAGAAPGGRL
jgi:nicotinate-nucleotide adenylyltransferase